MKLEGSLDAFSLPDIFQLLSFTKKSGGLHLASDGCDGVVFFAGGQVTGASADGSRQPLARRLIGAGAVDDDALAAAVEAATHGESVGVVKALLEQGAIEGDLLRQAVTDQSVDAVFDLLRWQQGDFAFVVDEANPDDVGVAAVDRGDPGRRRVAHAAAGTASRRSCRRPHALLAMPVVLPADPQVSREEWSLLALVDGRRSVGELVDLTGSGHYAVVSTLAGMVARGLLEVRDAADASRGPRRRRRTSPGLARRARRRAVPAGQELAQSRPSRPLRPRSSTRRRSSPPTSRRCRLTRAPNAGRRDPNGRPDARRAPPTSPPRTWRRRRTRLPTATRVS